MEAAKRRANTIVQIEWVLFALQVVFAIILITYRMSNSDPVIVHGEDPETIINRTEVENRAVLASLLGVFIVLPLMFNILLTIGVCKENRTCCTAWYIVAILGIIFHCLIFVLILISFNIIMIVAEGLWLGYKIYAMITIKDFKMAVEEHKNSLRGGVVYMAPGVINTGPPAPSPGPVRLLYGKPIPNPPTYDDATKYPPQTSWNNYPDYSRAVGV